MASTRIFDITGFAKEAETAAPLTVLFFSEAEFTSPTTTISALTANPAAFQRTVGDYAALMMTTQCEKVLHYLKQGNYRLDSIEPYSEPDVILVLSYGEGPEVNERLAEKAAATAVRFPLAELYMQWETAGFARRRGDVDPGRIHSIDLDDGCNYITSIGVVQKFKTSYRLPSASVYLVAQAWHAPRCLSICEKQSCKVVGGDFVDAFSPNDPQPWVRNWVAWILKEGTK